MSLTDELERLDALHRSGALSATEFQSAKERLLSGPDSLPAQATKHSGKRMELEAELARLDREFEMIRQQCLVQGRHGHASEPSESNGLFMAVGLVVFLTVSAFIIRSFMEHGGPMALLPLLIGFLGVWTMVSGIQSNRTKLERLNAAKADWQEARAEVLARIRALGL